MLLKLFRGNRSLIIIILPIIIIALWIPGFQAQDTRIFPFEEYPGLLYKILIGFSTRNILVSKIVALLLFFIISMMLVRLNITYFFIPSRTQMPAVIYMFIISSVVVLQRFSPVIISSLMIILAIDRIFGSYKYEGLAYHFFDSALLISLSSLIYINSLFFISFVWVGLLLLRTFNWREWTYTIIGLLLPYLFLTGYYYATDRSINDLLFHGIRQNFGAGFRLIDKITEIDMIGIVLMVYIIISSLFMMRKFDTKKIQARMYLLYFLWMFIILTLLFIFIPSFGPEYILFAAIPLTYLFSHYFVFTKINWFNRIFFSILILMPFYLVYYSKVYLLIKK